MPPYEDKAADQLLSQLAISTLNFAKFYETNPWLHAFAAQLIRKYNWALSSTYSEFTHPGLSVDQRQSITLVTVSQALTLLPGAL